MTIMDTRASDTTRVGDLPVPPFFPDPLEADDAADERVLVSRRGLCRLALVAVEVGRRFQREGVRHDPMSWMLSPLELFGGAAALDACVERDACMRAILVHGLSLGMDADPDEIDGLIDADADGKEDEDDIDWSAPLDEPREGGGVVTPIRPGGGGGPRERLFTATIASHDGFETVHAFHASLARDEAEVAGRLYVRLGGAAADASIVEGFEADAPMVEALVAPAMRHMLALVAADPGSPLALGLDVNVEQRFID